MSLRLAFLRAARYEFDEAADWYEQKRSGLGAAFTAAVRRVLDRVVDQPGLYAKACQDAREAPVSGYPYCVYYREEADQLLVLAVYHTSRDPSVWQNRV